MSDNEGCGHALHLSVEGNRDLGVAIDIDPDMPISLQLEAINAAAEGLLLVRAQCIELHRMRN